MRVLLIAHQYWPTPGSATQVLSALVRELIENGHTVDVITSLPRPDIALTELGPHGEQIHFGGPVEGGGTGLSRVRALVQFAFGSWRIGRSLRPDVVISDPPPTAGLAAVLIAKSARCPFVYYMADSWGGASADMKGLPGRAHRAIQAIENNVLRRADAVLAATHGMAAIAQPVTSKITVVENGVDLDDFSSSGSTWSPRQEEPFFLYAGNAGTVHGAWIFAEAANKMWHDGEDFDLVFMGHGPDFDQIRSTIGPDEERLHVIGTQPIEVVAAAYRGAVGALSSLRPFPKYADARPIKSMTGLAAGCPAVYAGSGAFADVLSEHGLGFVSPWSVDGAERSMRAVLTLHRDRPEAEKALRKRCSTYAVENLSDRASARSASAVVVNVQMENR